MTVLMLIKTSGLEYDDRLRKEATSLQRLGYPVEIVALEYANQAGNKMVYGRVPATTLHLTTRDLFKRGRGLVLKTLELYMHFIWNVLRRRPTVVWLHDVGLGGLIPLMFLLKRLRLIGRIVWDQHELPPDRILYNRLLLSVLTRLMNMCDWVLSANSDRKNHLETLLGSALKTNIEAVENYPDSVFAKIPMRQLPDTVRTWLRTCRYVLSQGGGTRERNLPNVVEAIMMLDNLKMIVVGPVEEKLVLELEERYGPEFRRRVLFTGYVPQLEIPCYIDNSVLSLVFYDRNQTNTWLCAPNRLFQALSRGIPVLVGLNPPMKRIVERYRCGLAVDGDSPMKIAEGIRQVLRTYGAYKENAEKISGSFVWEVQEHILDQAVARTSS